MTRGFLRTCKKGRIVKLRKPLSAAVIPTCIFTLVFLNAFLKVLLNFIRCKAYSVRNTSLSFNWVNLCKRPEVNIELAHFLTFMNDGMGFSSSGRIFQIAFRGREELPPVRGNRKFCFRGIFLSGGKNLRRRDFDHSNHLNTTFCQNSKFCQQPLKSKLA